VPQATAGAFRKAAVLRKAGILRQD
jgi:hypothetical protein